MPKTVVKECSMCETVKTLQETLGAIRTLLLGGGDNSAMSEKGDYLSDTEAELLCLVEEALAQSGEISAGSTGEKIKDQDDRNDNMQDAVAIIKEFMGDVEAVGLAHVRAEWPDLAVTYVKAKAFKKRSRSIK